MSDQFIAQQLSNGLSISRINSAQSGQVKQSLKDISASSANMGISDGEILCALADGRDKFDPFGIFCTVYGTLMRFMGSTIVLVLALIGLVLVARWIATAVANFGEWLRSAAGGIPLIGPVLKLAGIAKDEQTQYDSFLEQLSGAAFSGFIGGVVPAMIWGPLNAVVDQMSQNTAGGGGPPVAPPPGMAAVGSGPGLGQLVGGTFGGVAGAALGSGVDKILALLKGGGKDEELPYFTKEEIDALAQVSGRSRDALIRELRAGA